jgi:preprotein translocase subunit SecA
MDYLREGIGLRGYGQRDPLIEYQREGYDMFNAMMEGIKEESVGNLFNLQVQVQENPIVEEAGPDGGAAGPAAIDTPEAAGRPATPAPGVPGPRAGGPPRARTGGAHARPRSGAAQPPAAQPPATQSPGEQSPAIPAGLAPRRAQRLEYSAPSVDGGTHVETSRGASGSDEYSRVGRNDPCPCGSGRKFKRCHGDPRNLP